MYIEGEVGAFYLLTMLAGTEPRGLRGAKLSRVRFQGANEGYALDDIILEGVSRSGAALLEIQSKRDVTFAPKDPVFADVVGQVARSSLGGIPEDQHLLAVATQRQSRAIAGPYQDVLLWARAAQTSNEFFSRIAATGEANDRMRSFVDTFRTHAVAAGISDEHDPIWRLLRRFVILIFDFESTDPLARIHALALAGQILADEDVAKAVNLWSELIEIAISIGKVGGTIDRDQLRALLVERSFRFAGDRDYRAARALIDEQARHSLEGISAKVGGVTLLRNDAVNAVNQALEERRFVELQGGPGVGKSGILKQLAQRVGQEASLIVLDPMSTPSGGWAAYAQRYGIPGTAREFLNDLAASGGVLIVIDGLEMFTERGTQTTVNQILREAADIQGFAVIATARTTDSDSRQPWLREDVVEAFGGVHPVIVGELTDDEAQILSQMTPELRHILSPTHPASAISRNFYRLSRLMSTPRSSEIRTEADLAKQWWDTADYSPHDRRAGQRIIAKLAGIALAGGSTMKLGETSDARIHLMTSLTLTEVRRDHFSFYHDVLRDWGIASLIHEDLANLADIDLSMPASPRVARGIEFAARFALEGADDAAAWLKLLEYLSPDHAHSSWRRNALLAIARSELCSELLTRNSSALLGSGGALLAELISVIMAVETGSPAEIYRNIDLEGSKPLPKGIRFDVTGRGVRLLWWVIENRSRIPLQALGSVADLVQIEMPILLSFPALGNPTATMLFEWLQQLDVRNAKTSIPADKMLGRMDYSARQRMVENLRGIALLLARNAPEAAKQYLREIDREGNSYKVKAIRQHSAVLAQVAPDELADLVANSLIVRQDETDAFDGYRSGRAFGPADGDYLPASPAQPPFLDLLLHAKEVGLRLVRQLVKAAIDAHSDGRDPGENGFTIEFRQGPRFFPWANTYFWSRDQSRESSVGSALKALEAWGHRRLDAGEPVDDVLADVLGPPGTPAAFLLVAVDLLLSHFPASRSALTPFLANPELLSFECDRSDYDQTDTGHIASFDEPKGAVTLADLRARLSRKATLQNALRFYVDDDPDSVRLRNTLSSAVRKLEPYGEDTELHDPAFIGRHALNLITAENWTEAEGGRVYRYPADEQKHLQRLRERQMPLINAGNMDARIHLATRGGEYATPETARIAFEFAAGRLPDAQGADSSKELATQLVRTALLVARDGDDELLASHEEWVREVVKRALDKEADYAARRVQNFAYSRPVLGALAIIHLWRRFQLKSDRDRILSIAARRDEVALPAFAVAMPTMMQMDARLLKAGMRVAFAGLNWRKRRYGEDDELQKAFEQERSEKLQAAVIAEVAWLDGGLEPAWPSFPAEEPHVRQSHFLRVPNADKTDRELAATTNATSRGSAVYVETVAAAAWLALLNSDQAKNLEWRKEIVEAYAGWSARANGMGLPVDAEVDQTPSEWNNQFYALFAAALLDADDAEFGSLIEQVTCLPDNAFADVAETLILAADILYFNDIARLPERPVQLREHLAVRTMALRRWQSNYDPQSLSIDFDAGGIVARMLLNTHNPISGTNSYLVPAVAERLDPLLAPLAKLQSGGPTTFVAICTMNMLLVAPMVRHLDFLLAAIEAWFERVPSDTGLWVTAGVGMKVIEWFEAAILQDPALLGSNHPHRERIDRVIGRLVAFGIAEARELEKQIEAVSSPPE